MVLIKLKVHPDARKSEIIQKAPDAYEAWVKAPAERGLANNAALNLLAQSLGVPAVKLRIIKGARSPNKIIQFMGLSC
ncbi:MAG: DUF167 domain-containing protein [Elusimicrobia bacterium]|nr:DUF167 domain-containing protein [Elusimicrobiota bacterium]